MNVLEYFQDITTFVFDVDGVLTDGSVLLLENGLQARKMNVKDGLALQMALKNKYNVIIISGGVSEPVINRLKYLGIDEIHLGIKDKLKFLQLYVEQGEIRNEEAGGLFDRMNSQLLRQRVEKRHQNLRAAHRRRRPQPRRALRDRVRLHRPQWLRQDDHATDDHAHPPPGPRRHPRSGRKSAGCRH